MICLGDIEWSYSSNYSDTMSGWKYYNRLHGWHWVCMDVSIIGAWFDDGVDLRMQFPCSPTIYIMADLETSILGCGYFNFILSKVLTII